MLEEGDITLTEDGRRFVAADTEERKRLFAAALLAHVPLARMVRQVLDERWNHRASAVRFRDELEDHMSPDYAEDTLRTADRLGTLCRAVQLRRGGGAVQPGGYRIVQFALHERR